MYFLHCRFVAGSEAVLLATDVAARGLDIPAVDHVIHYQVPKDTEVCCANMLCLSHVVFTIPTNSCMCTGVAGLQELKGRGSVLC